MRWRDYTRRPLDVDDAEEQEQEDDQPRHAEDPEKQRSHTWPPFEAFNLRGHASQPLFAGLPGPCIRAFENVRAASQCGPV